MEMGKWSHGSRCSENRATSELHCVASSSVPKMRLSSGRAGRCAAFPTMKGHSTKALDVLSDGVSSSIYIAALMFEAATVPVAVCCLPHPAAFAFLILQARRGGESSRFRSRGTCPRSMCATR